MNSSRSSAKDKFITISYLMTKNWQSSDRANIASDIDVVSTNFKTIFIIFTKRSGSPSPIRLLTFETEADDFWIVETSPSGRKKHFCAGLAVTR